MCVDDIKIGWKETKHQSDVENTYERRWFGRTNVIPSQIFLDRTQRKCQISKDLVDNYKSMFESRISAGAWKITRTLFLHVPVTRKVMQRNAWKDIANWRIKQPNNWLQTILSCGKHCKNNADWDCFRTLTLQETLTIPKSTSGWTLCVFGSHTFVPISWMCTKQTAVSHSSTESEILFLLVQVYEWIEFQLLIFGIWLLHSSSNQLKKSKGRVQGDLLRDTSSSKHTNCQTKLRLQFSTTILNYATSIMFPQTWGLLNLLRCCTFLKIMKRWSRWSSRAEVQQWDTCPEPTELR